MDRLESYAIFVKAAETGSFSAAAEALNMSPQLVGRHIQRLETRMGVQLIQRTTRRQSLTDFGRDFLDRARQVLAEVDAAERLAEDVNATPRGRLRISAPVSFGISALSPILPDFLDQHPEVTIDLSLTNRKIDLYEEGFDLAFRVGNLPDSSLRAVPLTPYRLTACASPAYLANNARIDQPADLAGHNCLSFTHTELADTWTFTRDDQSEAVPVQGRFSVDHGEALREAAVAGFGIILQPDELVAPMIATGQLVRILPEWDIPTRPLHLLYRPERRLTPKLRSFIDYAKRRF